MTAISQPHGFGLGLWPYRPLALPDETLSSYLTRAAHGMGYRPITLLNICWGTSRSLLNQDLDNFAPDRVVDIIVKGTKRDPEVIRGMTLADFEGRLTPTFNVMGRQPWTLPSTISNNDRRRHGIQFCPACLRTDAQPYYRRTWRLAFATMCTIHGTPLLDACPDCGAVLHLHRAPSMTHCSDCGCDFRFSKNQHAQRSALAGLQSEMECALARGWAMLGNRQIYSHQFFAIVRQIAALMVNGKHAVALRSVTARELGGDASATINAATIASS